MAKQSATVRAALITGSFVVVAAVIGALVMYFKSNTSPAVSAKSTGDSSPAIAIVGDVRDSRIVVNPTSPKNEGLTEDARKVVHQILGVLEATPTSPLLAAEDKMESDASEKLGRDPYDVSALLMRGQWRYTRTRAGGVGMRGALSDFERAADVDKKLADPHFGIGTVLYQLAVFDLAQRGRYKIHERGGLRINTETGLLGMRHPSFELFPDRRTQTVLQAALDEFQAGQKMQQHYDTTGKATIMLYAPQDVEKRVRSIRCLLGYEPQTAPDEELVLVFMSYLQRVEPSGFSKLFEIESKK